MISRVSCFWPLALISIVALADEQETTEKPDMELIEFLGSFTTEQGEWVDPLGWIGNDEYVEVNLSDGEAEEVNDEPDD